MLHFILDGYNIINNLSQLRFGSLREARKRLIKFISAHKLTGSKNNKVTIVFDGKEGILDYPLNTSYEIIFSKGTTADEVIKEKVRKTKNPKNIIVVSNDRDLIKEISYFGAGSKSVEKFFQALFRKEKKTLFSDKYDLKFEDIEAINKELRKFWLERD